MNNNNNNNNNLNDSDQGYDTDHSMGRYDSDRDGYINQNVKDVPNELLRSMVSESKHLAEVARDDPNSRDRETFNAFKERHNELKRELDERKENNTMMGLPNDS